MPYGGSWKMNGRYDHFGADGMEQVREKQNVSAAETAKKAEMAAEEKEPGKLSEPQDEYISSEKSGKESAGLYRVGRDETGSRKIVFDDPKAVHAKDDPGGKAAGDCLKLQAASCKSAFRPSFLF